MDDKLVFDLNQAAIDGIRGAGATSQLIFVEGNSWTGAWTWVGSSYQNHTTLHNHTHLFLPTSQCVTIS